MIRITLPRGFDAERTYVMHVLVREHLGIEFTAEPSDERNYVIAYEGRTLSIVDDFFGHYNGDGDYLKEEAIPKGIFSLKYTEDAELIGLYGAPVWREEGIHLVCEVDLVAGAFYMLSRWEESVIGNRDQHDRFPAEASRAYQFDFLDRPVVDEYVAFLRYCLLRMGVPEKAFRRHTYQVRLQCDVDIAQYWVSPLSVPRKIAHRLIRQGNVMQAFREPFAYLRYLTDGKDPFDTYALLMDLAEQHGTLADFFFPVGGHARYDNRYTLRDAHVKATFDRIHKRGHRTGVHFSYASSEIRNQMYEEVKTFRGYNPSDDLISRFHFLRCSVPETWRFLAESGVMTDYTMGYPEAPGFRCGTSHAFSLFDIHTCNMLATQEQPLIAMDVTFHDYLKQTPEEAIAVATKLREQVRKHDGQFVLLWHNSSFGQDWQGWEDVPAAMLG